MRKLPLIADEEEEALLALPAQEALALLLKEGSASKLLSDS